MQVQIGRFKREYVIRETSAPRRYDGGSTITVHEYKQTDEFHPERVLDWRVVLIESAQLAWHEGRYGSGLYRLREPEYMDEGAIIDALLARLNPEVAA